MGFTGINNVVFVHIPKTAGTSLRKTLERNLKGRVHLFDYGPNQRLTSDAVRRFRYPETIGIKDESVNIRSLIEFWRRNERSKVSVCDLAKAGKKVFLMGHFEAHQYTSLFEPSSFVTFIRKPVDRVVSEYKHFVRNLGFEGSLREFCAAPYQRNKQSRYLDGLDLDSIGFIGRVENFEVDLRQLEHVLGIKLDLKRDNVAPSNQAVEVDKSTLDLIKNLNTDDLRLYDKVCNLCSKISA